jgi:hypothetical protein
MHLLQAFLAIRAFFHFNFRLSQNGASRAESWSILFPKPSLYYMPGLYYVRQKIYVDRGVSGGKTYRHFLRLRLA